MPTFRRIAIPALPNKASAKKPAAKTAATTKPKAPAKPVKASAKPQALTVVLTSLDDNKAQNVVAIDIAGRSSIADWMVIASGTSARHVASMAGHLMEKLKAIGIKPRDEGLPQADWVAVDGGDIVVHLFRPEVRTFYDLEGMWQLPGAKAKTKAKAAPKTPAKAKTAVPAKKPAVKKAAPAKKPAPKKPLAKKPAAKKPAAKKPVAKKPASKKKA